MNGRPALNPILKKMLRPVAKFASLIGFDFMHLKALRHYPRYQAQAAAFKRAGGTIGYHYPILTDYDAQAGAASGHYFHQDLLVASFIHSANPSRHIDIGSRIDGFVAHVAAFRKIEVMDVRELGNTGHPNIAFLKVDLMARDAARDGIADSISCLHAIEHFGLGRYGDPIDPQGHVKGFNNILTMLKPGGLLYISFPIGTTTSVHFNAHRVFQPSEILSWANDPSALILERFDLVDDSGELVLQANVEKDCANVRFGCGIYTIRKLS